MKTFEVESEKKIKYYRFDAKKYHKADTAKYINKLNDAYLLKLKYNYRNYFPTFLIYSFLRLGKKFNIGTSICGFLIPTILFLVISFIMWMDTNPTKFDNPLPHDFCNEYMGPQNYEEDDPRKFPIQEGK